MNLIRCSLVCLLLCFSSRALFAAPSGTFVSPDGKLKAVLLLVGAYGYENMESQVDIRTRDGQLLCSQNFQSTGRSGNGRYIEHFKWSPNSRFFVYTTSSSGGHSPWHYDTFFFSRKQHRILDFNDYNIVITEPDFRIKRPDVFVGTRWTGDPGFSSNPCRIKLGSL